MSCDSILSANLSNSNASMNHIGLEEEEELGIYSDDNEGAGDLSDDEPPITDQDTAGRPQSQFKLRVTSALPIHNRLPEAQRTSADQSTDTQQSNHLDSMEEFNDEDFPAEPYNKLDDLDINSETVSTRRQLSPNTQQQSSSDQQPNRPKDTKVK